MRTRARSFKPLERRPGRRAAKFESISHPMPRAVLSPKRRAPRSRICRQSFSHSADRYPRSYRKYWHELRASQQSRAEFNGISLKLCRTCRLASSRNQGVLEKHEGVPSASAFAGLQHVISIVTLLATPLSQEAAMTGHATGRNCRDWLTGRLSATGQTGVSRTSGISGQRGARTGNVGNFGSMQATRSSDPKRRRKRRRGRTAHG